MRKMRWLTRRVGLWWYTNDWCGLTVEFWTGIQTHYETEMVKMNLGDRLEKEVKVLVPNTVQPFMIQSKTPV